MDRPDIKEMTLTEKAVAALNDAVAKVIEEHRLEGRPLAVWRDGKVVYEMPTPNNIALETHGTYHAKRIGEPNDTTKGNH